MSEKITFVNDLFQWFEQNHRPMPWKGEKDPYLVWLSEIILQQTRVEQGLPYFERFKMTFPTVKQLADATEDEVMKLWQGLGYYSRARNLHETAKYIASNLNGVFPSDYSSILKLKGVGEYTAAAIASFAYDLPHAVVDGNVFRVLSRYFGVQTPIDTTTGKNEFTILANQLIPQNAPAKFNQAIMDFGATHCTPKAPSCSNCFLKQNCIAFKTDSVDKLPFKAKKILKKDRFFHFFVIKNKNFFILHKRTNKDIWQNLYEFPMIEADEMKTWEEIRHLPLPLELIADATPTVSQVYKQTLTHQKICAIFYEFEINRTFDPDLLNRYQFTLVPFSNLENFAFPKIIDLFFNKKIVPLELF